jgi:hypothetical protein
MSKIFDAACIAAMGVVSVLVVVMAIVFWTKPSPALGHEPPTTIRQTSDYRLTPEGDSQVFLPDAGEWITISPQENAIEAEDPEPEPVDVWLAQMDTQAGMASILWEEAKAVAAEEWTPTYENFERMLFDEMWSGVKDELATAIVPLPHRCPVDWTVQGHLGELTRHDVHRLWNTSDVPHQFEQILLMEHVSSEAEVRSWRHEPNVRDALLDIHEELEVTIDTCWETLLKSDTAYDWCSLRRAWEEWTE